METRANYVLIGLFTLAVIVAGIGFVFWFSRTGVDGERATYNVIFKGSVSGLKKGAQVMFNGIRVGDVTDLDLNPKDPREAIVTIVVDSARGTIRKDTRITLEYQGLTGIASVALQGGDPNAEPYKAAAGEKYPTIVVDTAGVQDLAQGARDLITRADTILRRLDGFLASNEQSASNVIKNVERFTAALGDHADEVASFMTDAASAARKFSTMAERIETLAGELTNLTKAVDTARVQRTVENIERFTDSLSRNAVYIDGLLKDSAEIARKFNGMTDRIETTVARVNDVLQAVDPQLVSRTLANVDRFTGSLGANSEKVDAMLKDAAAIAQQFNAMTPRVDKILANLEGLTGSDATQGAIADISLAAQSVRKTADNLDKRFIEISAGITRFTASGSRELEAVASEGKRALSSVERAVRNFDRNPSRVIFGGSGSSAVPQYGRR
jgi:phospholipid/cholesterol/gamma-HCH transport system substrate-binding protein